MQGFHSDQGNYFGILPQVMRTGFSWSRYYSRETQDKTFLSTSASVNYDVDGITYHPIGRAFTEAKAAGQLEGKNMNFIPYNWN